MIKYIAVQTLTPDVPRAWGSGDTHDTARLNCEIAIREKYLGKYREDIQALWILIKDILS